MLLNDDKFADKIEETTCRQCHDQKSNDHHAHVLAGRHGDCFSCHREHSGKLDLARVEDSFCTNCHHDLRNDEGPSGHFVRTIDSFSNHPEFAINRKPSDPNWAVSDSHRLHEVAELSADRKGWDDKTTIHFPHDKHLHPEGVMVPASHPLAEGNTGERKVLNCDSCHVTAADGRYMRPVVFERHCAECHPLSISNKALGPIPHEDPKLIQGWLRDRLMDYARQHPELISSRNKINESRLPNHPTRMPSFRDIWLWVEDQLTKQPDKETLSPAKQVEWTCDYCHTITPAENETRLLAFEVTPPRIPERWWGHASFRHDRHDVRIMACTDCHAARESSSAHDILLPSIENCRKCHTPLTTETQSGARHDCVECHSYHFVMKASQSRFTPIHGTRPSELLARHPAPADGNMHYPHD